MLGNQNLATITNGTVLFNHTDHLGSTVATTNQTGGIVETTDYSAFGHQNLRSTYQNTQQTEKYTGHTYDPETDLLYAQARYYRGSLGRFLSQDPLHWQMPKEYLVDPQQHNSYSYARNNPLKFVDTTGKYIESAVDVASLSLSVQDYQQDPSLANAAFVGLDAAALFLPAPALVGYVRHGGELFDVAKAGGKVVEQVQNGMAASKEVGNTNQIKSLIELNNNQNRVTLRSTSQKLEVDLAGKSHFDKTSGVNIPTPHTKTSTVNPSAPKSLGIQYNTTNGVLRPATIFDLRTVRRFLESSKKKK